MLGPQRDKFPTAVGAEAFPLGFGQPRCFGYVMPVEWLWKVMINELNENQIKVFSEQRLSEEIFKVWQKVCTKDFVFSLLNNITAILERVVKNQGDYVD